MRWIAAVNFWRRWRGVAAGVAAVLLIGAVWGGWEYWSRGPKEVRRIEAEESLLMAQFVAEGQRVALAKRWGKMRVRDVESFQPVGEAMEVDVRGAVVSGDGRVVVVCVPEQFDAGEVARLELWDVGTGKLSKAFELGVRESWVGKLMAVSRDGGRVVCLNEDELVVFERQSAGVVRRIGGEGMELLTRLVVTGDGRQVVGGGSDGVCRVWSLETGEETARFGGHGAGITALAEGSDVVVSADESGAVCMWDIGTGKERGRFSLSGKPVTTLAVWGGAERVLTGDGEGRVCLWEGATGRRLARFARHSGGILAVGFSPDGRRAISAGEDGTIRQWALP